MTTPLFQKLLIVNIVAILITWAGDITLRSSKWGFRLQETLSDPYGCSLSPDNFGCELNRPFDKERKEQPEASFVSEELKDE
ncbi:MAG: hypothetical protein LDL41_15895 [Coleofasciculus sp. S288]|nr:hypothetical protein [Coleofasciculus sp. S288]